MFSHTRKNTHIDGHACVHIHVHTHTNSHLNHALACIEILCHTSYVGEFNESFSLNDTHQQIRPKGMLSHCHCTVINLVEGVVERNAKNYSAMRMVLHINGNQVYMECLVIRMALQYKWKSSVWFRHRALVIRWVDVSNYVPFTRTLWYFMCHEPWSCSWFLKNNSFIAVSSPLLDVSLN